MGNIIPLESRKRQEIEDLANSMLETFATEYRTIYGCEVFASYEESDEYQPSLKFCPWERLDYPIKQGYLTKQGAIRKSWRRRYFVVQPNYLIDYYESEEGYEKGLKPKGTINPCGYKTVSNLDDHLAKRQKKLAAMLGADRQDSTEKFPEYTFGVVHNKYRSYFIHAEDDDEMMEWVRIFQLCCASVKAFNISDPICQSTFNKAISKTLTAYGNPEHHSYRGSEEKVICDVVTAEIDGRIVAEICKSVNGNFTAKMKTRDHVLKDLDASVMSLVTPMWRNLKEDKNKIQMKVETLIREKNREIAAVRRKVEWEMSGKCETFLNDALTQVRTFAQKVFPILEKSLLDALCEVRNIYQKNVIEIGVDVEQREEVEIPVQMYIDSLDMMARIPSEMETAYNRLYEMEQALTSLQNDVNTFNVSTILSKAQEKLRLVMDALVNTFQQKFLELSCRIQEGKQKHKKLRNLIEDVDDEVANLFENDTKEIIYSFNMKTLKTVFLPYIHKKIDRDCNRLVESADSVIPEHFKIVLNRNNEYRCLVERSVEELLKQVMKTNDEARQRSFRSSLRNSRRKTFPKFTSRQTRFQDAERAPLVRRTSFPETKNGVVKPHERKTSFSNFMLACLPIQAEFRDSGVYEVMEESSDDMQEINLRSLERGTASFGRKRNKASSEQIATD